MDTTRVTKEYGPDNILVSIRQQKMVNGCWKDIQHQQYDKNGYLESERRVKYAEGKDNTCDFTAYVEHNLTYKKSKLTNERYRQAACEECDASPCGISKRWDSSGKLVYSKVYNKCSFQPAKRQ